jgi:hypothetical protein
MRTRLSILALVAAAATASLAAQTAPPNFSGTWRLNVAKSFMGIDHPFPAYQLTRTIKQEGDTLSITDASVNNSFVNIPLPDSTSTMQITADGRERDLELPSGFPGRPPTRAQVTAAWQSGTLQLLQLNNGLAAYARNRLYLTDNGAQLIELAFQHSIYGDTEQRLVFDKAQ